jgi:hypothetical protein
VAAVHSGTMSRGADLLQQQIAVGASPAASAVHRGIMQLQASQPSCSIISFWIPEALKLCRTQFLSQADCPVTADAAGTQLHAWQEDPAPRLQDAQRLLG